MSEPNQSRWEQFTDEWGDWIGLAAVAVAAVLVAAAVAWPIKSTNSPAYEPPSSYQTGEPR